MEWKRALFLLLPIAACTAEGSTDVFTETDDAGATEPEDSGVVLPPASNPDGGGVLDAKSDAKTKTDAEAGVKEAGVVDAGPPPPSPGDACAVVDEIFSRQCGACGTQQAICLADGTVSDYSLCTNELDGGCVPNTSGTEACGNCGTRTRSCNKYCAWTFGACTGEPPNSCSPTTNDWTVAGCVTANTYRTRECGDKCTWSSFTSCETLDFELGVSSAKDAVVSAIYPLRALVADKKISGTCGSNYFSTAANYPYVYVKLVNPSASTLTMSAWNSAGPSGAKIDTVMTVYATTTKPADDTARKACVKTVSTYCPTGLPCGGFGFAGLTAANAFTIPPNGAVLLFFQSYYAAGGSSLSEGEVKLSVRTDAVQ